MSAMKRQLPPEDFDRTHPAPVPQTWQQAVCLGLLVPVMILFLIGCFVTLAAYGQGAIAIDGRFIALVVMIYVMVRLADGAGLRW